MAKVSLLRDGGGAPDMPVYDGPLIGEPAQHAHHGLCITLNDEVLDALGMEDEASVGARLHLNVEIEVVAVHHDESGRNVRAAIVAGAVDPEGQDEPE